LPRIIINPNLKELILEKYIYKIVNCINQFITENLKKLLQNFLKKVIIQAY